MERERKYLYPSLFIVCGLYGYGVVELYDVSVQGTSELLAMSTKATCQQRQHVNKDNMST